MPQERRKEPRRFALRLIAAGRGIPKQVEMFWLMFVTVVIGLFSCLPLSGQAPSTSKAKIAEFEQQVSQHLKEQKPQLAIPLLEKIASLDPQNVNAQANLGVLLHFEGRHSEAIPHLRAALQLQPGLWRIQALLGIAEKRTGDASQAVLDLEAAFSHLDKDKTAIQVGLELIEIHTAAARFEKALAVVVQLVQMAPNDPQVLLATHQIARQTMDQAMLNMMIAAPDSAQMHMIMAGELVREGNLTGAIGKYREAIRLDPSLPGVHLQLAEVMKTSPDPAVNAQAEGEYRAALKANPYDAVSWRQLGDIMNAKGDFPAAEENFKRAIALQPNDADAKTGLATVLANTKRADEAIPLLESAVKDDPTNLTAHFRLSGLYKRAGRTADAARHLKEFRHYQELKDKLGQVLKSRRAPAKQP